MISAYKVEIIIDNFEFKRPPLDISLELTESVYGSSTYILSLFMDDIESLNKLIERLDEDNSIELQWFEITDKDVYESEIRKVDVVDCSFNFLLSGYRLEMFCTDKTYWMRNKARDTVYYEKTLEEILKEIAKEYEIEVETTIDKNKRWTLAQAENTDYDFIRGVLLPRASQCIFENNEEKKIPSTFLFYVDKGEKLIVTPRGEIKKGAKTLTFTRDAKKEDDVFLDNHSVKYSISPSSFYNVGTGIDYITQPPTQLSFEEGNEDGIQIKYDGFAKEPVYFNKGPRKIQPIVLDNIRKDTKVDKVIQGRMSKPMLYSKYQMTVVSYTNVKVSPGVLANVIPPLDNELFYKGKWFIHSFKTKIDSGRKSSFTVYYLERSSNE